MPTVTVSSQGQVMIPDEIRRRLGIQPGNKLDFEIEGNAIRVELHRHPAKTSSLDDGYGMLTCTKPGTRRLCEFDIADAMREAMDDRP